MLPKRSWKNQNPMLSSAEGEMREMAEMELQELSEQLDNLQELELRSLLVPKDPRDNRNVIIEIRAGTGGNEAALFASDLLRMYLRYADCTAIRPKFSPLTRSASAVTKGSHLLRQRQGRLFPLEV